MLHTNLNLCSRLKVTVLILATTLGLSACSETENVQDQIAVVQAVKLAKVVDSPKSTERVFPAEVSAVKTIDVSFEVSGRLITTNLKTGNLVKKGDVLAKIDPTPFEQSVKEAEARFEQADRSLKRISSTFDKGLISLSEFDNAKTSFELAKIALQKAEQDLSYTQIISPFDAQISERFVDNGSYVKTGDIIAHIQDVSHFYFNINVPERLLSRYKGNTHVTAQAFIISSPEKHYNLEYIEHDTQPDPVTQTYKVVFASKKDDGNLTPGARAVVNVNLAYQSYGDGFLVPFSSLVGNNSDGFKVWRFNKVNKNVEAVSVNVLHIKQDFALINGEIASGDLVVAAGANKMREGLVVKPYQAEQ
ncbi:efflux RND transporter periplasmic adaptor subunit [Thalassotalea profundi]|uniref:Hemolysin secretion protein D n=1 Tax=Thalassotalea profundi TaxID=2036687 RepID=A0ABQ3IL66_9GAMM|nr:efflux RND transporter periplasmic adaptor subunit [Thalassotalea profundi]GHE87650.1 hemolysin secretion protein D [Thalassotalea profundi]